MLTRKQKPQPAASLRGLIAAAQTIFQRAHAIRRVLIVPPDAAREELPKSVFFFEAERRRQRRRQVVRLW